MSGKDKSVYDKLMEIRQEIIDMHYKKGLEDGLDIKLTRIRDALLPRLMSGEIDVSNIKI